MKLASNSLSKAAVNFSLNACSNHVLLNSLWR